MAKWIGKWKRTVQYLPVFAAAPLVFFVSVPLQLYIPNAEELQISLRHVLIYSAAFFAISLVTLSILGTILPKRAFSCYCAALFAVGLIIYAQSNFLSIKIGVLNGQAFDASHEWGRIILNLVLWIALPIIAVVFGINAPELAEKVSKYGSYFLSAMQVVAAVLLLVSFDSKANGEDYMITAEGFNELSSEKNAIIIVMDMFDETYMTEILEKEPEVAEKLDGFIHFTNATGKYSTTCYGVPFLIGQEVLLNQGYYYTDMLNETYERSNMLNQLMGHGYRLQLYTDAGLIRDYLASKIYNVSYGDSYVVSNPVYFCELMVKLSLLRGAPDMFKTVLQFSSDEFSTVISAKENEAYSSWSLTPYQKMMNNQIDTVKEPVFSVIHVRGVHYPYEINENLELVEEGSITYYEQALGTIRAVTTYLDRLKEAGIYDNSTIILTADHGFYKGGAITNPTFLVKHQNSRGVMLDDKTPVSHDNVEEVILGDAGLDYKEKDDTQRTFFSYALSDPSRGVKFALTEWNISDDSNQRESFVRSGYRIDIDGVRGPLSKYAAYQWEDEILFGKEGNEFDYFDYGIGEREQSYTTILGTEGKFTFSHQAILKDMLLNITFINNQTDSVTISLTCNGTDCGKATLMPGQDLCQWRIPAECLSSGKAEIYLSYEGLVQVWPETAEHLGYRSMFICEYNGEEIFEEGYVPQPLNDFQAQILFYEMIDDRLLVTVKNTSTAEWRYRDRVRCYLRVNGNDSGIRAELSPVVVIKPGEDVQFIFEQLNFNAFSNATVEIQMMQEGYAYFGDTMEISLWR